MTSKPALTMLPSGLCYDMRVNHSLTVRDGHLFMEGCNTVEIARKFGTPLFLVSENHLRHNLRLYTRAFEDSWTEGPVRIMPSLKANPVIAIRKILSDEGAGCDVFGSGELHAALRGGVAPEAISVNGSIKDREIITTAIEAGARIVLDSPRELELCEEVAAKLNKVARVMFRIKPYMEELEAMSDYTPEYEIRFMTQAIKYGIPTSELLPMGLKAKESPHIDPAGVHVHMGRHSKKPEVWRSWVMNCVKLTKELSDTMNGWVPREMNFGGGFPSFPDKDTDVTVKGYPGPSLEEIADVLTSSLRAGMRENKLETNGLLIEVEPGRGIHCDTGVHLTTIRNTKHETRNREHRWAEVDTSQVFLGVNGANFNQPKFDFVIANNASGEAEFISDIVGLTCNLEVLFYQVAVPALETGDVVALLNTGSYIEPCTQNFNALPRPGMVLVNGSQAELIKRHETIEDVFARDIVPARFADAETA